MNSSFYKYCIVPQCKSTTIKTPNKLFIYVPNNNKIRKKWLTLAGRNGGHNLSTTSKMYFCEDHFDMPKDMVNYMEYHVMGSVSQVRMIPGCVPTKFKHHNLSTQQPFSSATSEVIIKDEVIIKQDFTIENEGVSFPNPVNIASDVKVKIEQIDSDKQEDQPISIGSVTVKIEEMDPEETDSCEE